MAKNLILGPILAGLAQMWTHKIYFVGFTSTSSWILFQTIILCNFQWQKNLILCSILQCLPQIWAPIFLFVGFTSTSTQTLIHPIILGKFNGKLMNQTREMAKKTNFGPGFGQFGTNFNQNFFCGCYIHQILTIVSNFHCMQFQGKLRNQTCEMTKKTQFQAQFWPLRPKLGLPNVFKKNLAQSVTTYHGQL